MPKQSRGVLQNTSIDFTACLNISFLSSLSLYPKARLHFRVPIKDFKGGLKLLTRAFTRALLFGRSVYSLRANIDQAVENRNFADSFEVAQEGLAKRFRLAPFHFLYSPAEFRRACRNVHRFVEKYIRQRQLDKRGHKTDPGAEYDNTTSWFIDQIAAESESEVDLRDQLLNILLAGRDTTACCLSWML